MAYQYDEMGNVIGQYESEEERRRREQANQPVKQTITYNPDGTSEVTIKGTPESLSSANPNTPTVSGPVSPEETYQRMLQAESGNRDYTASGQPVTSPKGAMFASQVMPATAANPGYGVRPATSQTPEEYNRVGREYYQALLKQFGGDTQKAAAAYNAGPGRVQQNIRQNQGQMNVAQLPKETQGYLQKIGQTVSNMIPSAQAGTLPQGPVSPQQLAQQTAPRPVQQPAPQPQPQAQPVTQPSQYSLATGMGQPGLRVPQAQPMVTDTSMYVQQYVGIQDDPQKLIQYGFNETVPEPLRNRAKNRAAELIQQQQGQQEAKQRLETMTETDLAKALREKTTGGSYLKAALFGLLGMEQSAMAEAAKLGVGKETSVMLTDGTPAMIKVAANGTPISGYNATTGKKLTSQELISAQAGSASKLNIVGGTFINDQTGEVGRAITDERTGVSYIQTDKGRKPMTGFRPQSSAGSLTDQRAKLVQDINLKLQGKTEEEKMAILRPYNQQLTASGYPAISPQEVGISAPQIQAPATATTATTVAPGAPVATTQTAPAKAPGATATVKRPTGPELEAQKTKLKETAEEEGVDIGKIKVNQPKAESNADYLLTKIDELVGNPNKDIKQHPGFETSVGAQGASYLFGLRDKPVAPQFGGGDARDFQNRMREITGQSFLQAIESLRGMGALSNLEGEAATRAIQRMGYVDKDGNLVITATEKEFKAAAKDFQDVIQRGVDRNRIKLGQKPKYGTPEASEQPKPAETKTGKLTAEDREAIEWVRKNPNDPRTPEIKKRLGL